MGMFSSAVCLVLYAWLNALRGIDSPGDFVKQYFADVVFYLTLNFIGFYFRYVGEINMRRGFLDKRGCIETTFKLKYEKEQEVRIMWNIEVRT